MRIVSGNEQFGQPDVVVVGGGMSGLAFGGRLVNAQPEAKVLVLEHGPFMGSEHLDSRSGGFSGHQRWLEPKRDPLANVVTGADRSWASTERRVLGGRSLYWGGVLCPIDPLEFTTDRSASAWLRAHHLSGEQLGYRKVRDSLTDRSWFVADKTPELKVQSRLGEFNFAPADRAARRVGDSLRTMTAVDLVDGTGDGLIAAVGCEVVDISRSGPTRWTVRFQTIDGRAAEVMTQNIVLAAGTIGNCRLLGSAMGPSMPTSFWIEDHVVAGAVRLDSSPSSSRRELAANMRDKILFADLVGHLGFNLFLTASESPRGIVWDCWGKAEYKQGSGGIVTVGPGRETSAQSVGYAANAPMAQDMITAAEDVLMEVAAAGKETAKLATIEAMALFNGDAPPIDKTVTYESLPGTVDHDGCIKRLLGNEVGALTVPEGMWLVGPSSFPRMGAANPTLTTLALAFELADLFQR